MIASFECVGDVGGGDSGGDDSFNKVNFGNSNNNMVTTSSSMVTGQCNSSNNNNNNNNNITGISNLNDSNSCNNINDETITVNVKTSNGTLKQIQYVTKLNEPDVLFGRGSGPNDHEGNMRFRTYVAERKAKYMATNHRLTKTKIAREIVDLVTSNNGRFLKRLEPKEVYDSGLLSFTKNSYPPINSAAGDDPNDVIDMNNRNAVVYYEIQDDETCMEKAKQALRQNATKFREESYGSGCSKSLASVATAATAASTSPLTMIAGSSGISGLSGTLVEIIQSDNGKAILSTTTSPLITTTRLRDQVDDEFDPFPLAEQQPQQPQQQQQQQQLGMLPPPRRSQLQQNPPPPMIVSFDHQLQQLPSHTTMHNVISNSNNTNNISINPSSMCDSAGIIGNVVMYPSASVGMSNVNNNIPSEVLQYRPIAVGDNPINYQLEFVNDNDIDNTGRGLYFVENNINSAVSSSSVAAHTAPELSQQGMTSRQQNSHQEQQLQQQLRQKQLQFEIQQKEQQQQQLQQRRGGRAGGGQVGSENLRGSLSMSELVSEHYNMRRQSSSHSNNNNPDGMGDLLDSLNAMMSTDDVLFPPMSQQRDNVNSNATNSNPRWENNTNSNQIDQRRMSVDRRISNDTMGTIEELGSVLDMSFGTIQDSIFSSYGDVMDTGFIASNNANSTNNTAVRRSSSRLSQQRKISVASATSSMFSSFTVPEINDEDNDESDDDDDNTNDFFNQIRREFLNEQRERLGQQQQLQQRLQQQQQQEQQQQQQTTTATTTPTQTQIATGNEKKSIKNIIVPTQSPS